MNASYAWYVAALVVVALMVNTSELWQAFTRSAGSAAAAAPVAAALAALTAAAIVVLRRNDRRTVRFTLLGGAAATAAVGLALTDFQYPAKRIHVAEYIAVAWLIFQGLGERLAEPRRAAAAALIATLLGVHDELIQGLHPDRTFGIVDMVTNGIGATAGAIAALAMIPTADMPDAPRASRHVAIIVLTLCATLPVYPLIAAQLDLPFE